MVEAHLKPEADDARESGRKGGDPGRAIDAPRVLAHEAGLMTSPLSRFLRSLAFVAALAAPLAPARALVGAEPDGRFADRVAMVLIRGGDKAGFCSALVLSPRVLLTAAHCLRPLRDMAVHYRDAAGAPVIIPVDAAIAHPLYRADAIKARVESIDLALIRTVRPLPPAFRRRGDRRWRAASDRRISHRFGLWRGARGRLVVGRAIAQRNPCCSRTGVDGSHLGRRSDRKGGRRLQRRFRRARLVGGRIGCDCDRRLGAGAARPRLRRLDARPAACAAEKLDRGDGAQTVREPVGAAGPRDAACRVLGTRSPKP